MTGTFETRQTTDATYPYSIEALRSEVERTRAAQRTEQGRHGINAERLATARAATLSALEDYAAAIKDRGWPVPRLISQDLRLLRSLCGTSPRQR